MLKLPAAWNSCNFSLQQYWRSCSCLSECHCLRPLPTAAKLFSNGSASIRSYMSFLKVIKAVPWWPWRSMKDINSFRVEFLQIQKEQTLRTMKKVAANYLPGASNCSSRSSSRRRSGEVQCTWNFSLMSAAPAARRKPIRCSCCPWVSRLSMLTMMPIQGHKRVSSLITRPGTTCSWSRRRSSGACLSPCWCISSAVIKYNFSRPRWLPTFNSDP